MLSASWGNYSVPKLEPTCPLSLRCLGYMKHGKMGPARVKETEILSLSFLLEILKIEKIRDPFRYHCKHTTFGPTNYTYAFIGNFPNITLSLGGL